MDIVQQGLKEGQDAQDHLPPVVPPEHAVDADIFPDQQIKHGHEHKPDGRKPAQKAVPVVSVLKDRLIDEQDQRQDNRGFFGQETEDKKKKRHTVK